MKNYLTFKIPMDRLLSFSDKNDSNKFNRPFWSAFVCALGCSVALVAMFLSETSAGLFCTGTDNLGEARKSTNKELIMLLVDYPKKNLVMLTASDCHLLAKACDAYMDTDAVIQSDKNMLTVGAFVTAFQSMALAFQYEFHIHPKDQETALKELMEEEV